MNVFGELKNADLENRVADTTPGTVGRIYWNTVTLKAMMDDGTALYAFLRNDGKAILGNHATANNNIRFHRGAAEVLQFVKGADATAEGTLSTNLAQISAKIEGYANASLPAAGQAGRIAWVTDLKTLKADNGADWVEISSSSAGGINYLVANPGAEFNTNGWATYADAAANMPADGTGGSPLSTWTRSTSTPLRGDGSFLWTKAGSANRQGEGVSFDFTIDAADKGKVLGLGCDYAVLSGTFTAADSATPPLNDGTTSTTAGNSDLEFFVLDVTNNVLIPVTPQALMGAGSLAHAFKGYFQAAPNSTSYRFIVHTATSTTNNFVLKFDNFFAGPEASGVDSGAVSLITSGPASAITGSASDVTGWATVTKDSTASFNPTTGEYTVPVSGDYVVNANALVTGAGVTVGQYVELDILKNGTPISSGTTVAGGSVTVLNVAANSLLSCVAGDIIKLQILSNGTLTGFDAGGQYTWLNIYRLSSAPSGVNSGVIAAQVGLTSNYAATTNVIYDTVISDTNAAYSTITGLYTVPVSGYYKMSVVGLTTAAGGFVLNIIKNGVHDSYLTSISDTVFGAGSLTVKCVAGDTLGIAPNSPATFVGASAPAFLNTFTIEQISGTVTPSASDTVSAQLSLSGNTGTTANAVIILDVVRQDTTASYSPITGLFTVPISGTYEISFTGLNTLVTPIGIYVAKNGVGIMYLCSAINTSFGGGTQLISAKAGDTLGIFSDGITTLAGGSSGSIQNITYVSILRVGN